MLYPAMNKLTEYIPNRYMMVNVVARRARQIASEAEYNGYCQYHAQAMEWSDLRPVRKHGDLDEEGRRHLVVRLYCL